MRTVVLLSALAFALRCSADGPLSPRDALASFKLEPNLRAELVAAEPLTASPCALTWDERGRLFVAENRGYPTGGPDGKPLGVIALLEDTDGDGRADKRTVFADGLTFPNGLSPWRGGLIVTCAPDVLWLADTNGDGRADVRRVLLTGFSTNGSTQLRVSSPTLGPDGWIWLTCGLSGANITCPEHPERPALKTTTDVRFHPDTLEVEAVDGRGQFGQTFDDFGRRFICMNRVQVQHVVMPSRYLNRNPNLAFSEMVQNCPELVPNPLMKGGGGAARIYPISANVTTADSHAGTFTAACGVHIFRGDALPNSADGLPGYRGRVFSCDPTANLVHWDELIPTGATFAARRSTNQIEFLASTDNWFRPVFLATGPDGALYLADMYRQTIEHPEYLPVEVRKRTDFEGGKGMGRIWRVTRPGRALDWNRQQNSKKPALPGASGEQLCREFKVSVGWRCDTAFRLLLERRDLSVVPFLKAQATDRALWAPVHGLRAMRVLDAYGQLDEAIWLAAFDRGGEEMQAAMLELAASRWTNWAGLQTAALAHLSFGQRAGLWSILATGTLPYAQKRERLIRLFDSATANALDPWQRATLLSSLKGQALPLLRDLGHEHDRWSWRQHWEAQLRLFFELGGLAADESTPEELHSLAGALADFARQCVDAEELTRRLYEQAAQGGGLVGVTPGPKPQAEWELPVLHGVLEHLPASQKLADLVSGTNSWEQFIGKGRKSATGQGLISNPPAALAKPSNMDGILWRSRRALAGSQPLTVRVAAARLLGESGQQEDQATLLRLFNLNSPPELNLAAVRAFIQLAGKNAAAVLLTKPRWGAYSPAMREAVVGTLFTQPMQLAGLLDVIESGSIPPHALDSARRGQLLKHKDDAIRQRAAALFQQPPATDRMRAYEQAKAALTLTPHAATGREVFKRACANCHRLDREGVAVGPDLFDVRNQPKETLLLHIIVPEFEIAPNFTGYTVETKDGRTLSGLMAGESPTSVTLRQALGVEETVLRANIASLEASRLSIMPQELEKTMTTQELADLLAYLKGEK